MALAAPQVRLIGRYVLLTLVYGFLWTGIHFLLHLFNLTPPSLFFYLPFVVVGAILFDLWLLRPAIKSVQFKGAGTITVPTVYYMAILTSTIAFLNAASLVTDRVVEMETIDQLPQTASTFIRVRQFIPRPDYLVDTAIHETEVDEDDGASTQYRYTALVPLAQQKKDTLFTTWIVSSGFEVVNGARPAATIVEKKQAFWETHRRAVLERAYDSIFYFEKTDADPVMDVLSKKRSKDGKPVFVLAFPSSPSTMRWNMVKFLSWSYVALSVFFIGAVAFGHNEEIVND